MKTIYKETKKDRRNAFLEKHYKRCELLGDACGSRFTGKKISVELMKLERIAHNGATAYCNGESFAVIGRGVFHFSADENAWDDFASWVKAQVAYILGSVPKGFFVNGDARGYALKLEAGSYPFMDYTDWGSYQILSPSLEENV